MAAAPSQRASRRVVVHALSSDFRAATKIVEEQLPPPSAGSVTVRIVFAGVNASDVNYSAGKYRPGVKPPFPAGMEAVGEVVALGSGVQSVRVGAPVGFSAFGAYAEFMNVPERLLVPLPSLEARWLTVLVSGITASVALAEVAQMTRGETVLVTAAAGGTGLFAVQLAKAAGNRVIGTCSSREKAELLLRLGCDRAINYKEEDVDEVLRRECPKGVDIVYESVGGAMFFTAAKHLAVRGRLVVIGMVSGYQDGSAWTGKAAPPEAATLPARLLEKSASVRGFFLPHFPQQARAHTAALLRSAQQGSLQCLVDPRIFAGLEAVPDAVEYMYSGASQGKVVVHVAPARAGRL